MPCTAQLKGRNQTSISWWHFRFLHELSQHPQPTHRTLDLQLSTPHFPASMPTNNSIHPGAPTRLWLKPMRHFLHDCIRHWLQLFLPSKTVGLTWLICLLFPQRSLCLGVPDACPESWWLQWSVGVRGYLHASEHSCGIATVCNKGGKWAAKLSSVAVGSDYTSHIHTSTCIIFLHECDTLPAEPHKPLPLMSQGAACRSLEIKTHPLPLVPHQTPKAFTLRTGFYEPFINTVHFLGDWNYSVSSLLSYNSQGLIINGPVKQYTACCILIQ